MTLTMLHSILPLLIVAFGCVLSLLLIAWRRSQQLILIFTIVVLISALTVKLLALLGCNQAT